MICISIAKESRRLALADMLNAPPWLWEAD